MNTSLFRNTPTVTGFDSRGLRVRDITYHRHPDSPNDTSERISRHVFNAQGFLVRSADPRLHEKGLANFIYQTDLVGKVLSTVSADAGITLALYDAAGRPGLAISNLSVAEDGAPDTSEVVTRIWQYEEEDMPGRPLAVTEVSADGSVHVTERFVYGANSPAEQAMNLAGRCVRHYDTTGLLQTDSVGLTGASLCVTRHLLSEVENPTVVANWLPEGMAAWEGLLAEEKFSTVTTTDATGAVLSITDAKGNVQRVTYDVTGQLSSSWLTVAGGAQQIIVGSLTYSAAGQKLCEVHGNGVMTTYTYEPGTQRLSGIRTERAGDPSSGAKVLQDLRYKYDPAGNVLKMSNAAEEVRFWRNQKVMPVNAYGYDSLYQLVAATGREMANAGQRNSRLVTSTEFNNTTYANYTRTYTYDRSGNLTRIRHSAPGTNNSYTTDITVSDRSNRGVLSTLTESPAQVHALFTAGGRQLLLQAGQSLNWTPRGELQRVVPVARIGAPDDVESYRYDSASQRLLKFSTQKISSSMQTQRVVYLPTLELRNTTRASAPTESLQVITVGESGRARVRVMHWEIGKPEGISNDQVRYCYENLQGSSSLEVDGNGRVISQEEYYPYGGTSVLTASSDVEVAYKTVRYSGKERDATGLYYYGYRYYQPWVGRWLSADPLGAVDGLNPFCFCGGNPVSYIDKSGLVGVPITQRLNNAESHWGVAGMEVLQGWADFAQRHAFEVQGNQVNARDVVVSQVRDVMLNQPSEHYNARFQPGTHYINEQSLIERASIGRIYRLDWSSPSELLSSGFRASSDFTAVENMLHGGIVDQYENGSEDSNHSDDSLARSDAEIRRQQETLIASTEITGVDYYVRVGQAKGNLYEIDATGISGVSVTDNVINNPGGVIKFFDDSQDHPVTRESAYGILSNFGIDIELEEVHVDVSQLNDAIRRTPDRVRFIHRYG
ncbi:RHS repeat domain-containing protein [Pseudomonas sp. Marseille-P9899]|uniref:RHS repeat domain-containing protein n=1 Tax=Pseudomonas sp. Marseille-P9899 TaxID=2730401 RepID=UPI001588A50B|nr:RHS repeat domain-containing protein [Pseudomonas sp. Marseille-P9899]